MWRAVIATWRAVIGRAVDDRTLNDISRLVVNRRWWRWCVINWSLLHVDRGRGRIDRTGGHCCTHHATDDGTDYCRATPARTAAMGFSLACESEGT
jgi:hypothetical protein